MSSSCAMGRGSKNSFIGVLSSSSLESTMGGSAMLIGRVSSGGKVEVLRQRFQQGLGLVEVPPPHRKQSDGTENQ